MVIGHTIQKARWSMSTPFALIIISQYTNLPKWGWWWFFAPINVYVFSQIKNDGTLDKYIKKKIAAKGYDQKSDIGYEDTYI